MNGEKQMRTSKSKNQDWYKWEEYVANSLDGKTTPGSGNQDFFKGDFLGENWFVDCKMTKSDSYSIKNSLFEKYDEIVKLEGKEMIVALNLNGRKLAILDFETFKVMQKFYFDNNK